MKLIAAFRNFANVPINLSECIRAGYPEHDAGTRTISQLFWNTTSIFRSFRTTNVVCVHRL